MNVTDALVNRELTPIPVVRVVVVALQPQPVNAIVKASESAALRISSLTLNDKKEAHLMPLRSSPPSWAARSVAT
jgi:hypothetical protein